MKTNIIQAIINMIDSKAWDMKTLNGESFYNNRINNMGVYFENLIKDSICNGFHIVDSQKINEYNKYFSYLGNQNNPPDLIIKNGDALEIKKIETNDGNIALNSSFPKDKLYSDSPLITNSCKNCEEYAWVVKDICYVIGCFDKNKNIKNIWFIYGDCYCCEPLIYNKIKNLISSGLQNIGIELHETNEIAKIKKIDPLGITNLRVRGMWDIKHPNKVFEYIVDKSKNNFIRLLLKKDKYLSFDLSIRNSLESKGSVKEVKICNPNNPAKLMDAVFLEYEIKR